jgi:hypothetical protein
VAALSDGFDEKVDIYHGRKFTAAEPWVRRNCMRF